RPNAQRRNVADAIARFLEPVDEARQAFWHRVAVTAATFGPLLGQRQSVWRCPYRPHCLVRSLGWLIAAGHGSKADVDPIPGVDGSNRPDQVTHFVTVELRLHPFEDLFGNRAMGDLSQFFGQEQGRSFAFAVVGALSPG